MLPWLSAIGAGISLAGMVWLGLRSWHGVPREARRPTELPMPLWWRLLWPLAGVGAWYGRRFLSWRGRRRIEEVLRQAGLRHVLQPAQVAGMQLAVAVAGAAVSALLWTLLAGALWQPLPAGGVGLCAVAGFFLPRLWLRDQIRLRRRQVLRTLPFALDMVTLCVEGGLNLHGALQQAADKGPPGPLRDELHRVLGDIRTGMSRADALRQLAQRVSEPAVRNWVSALIQAESLGMNLAPILRAQADQRRAERLLQAEKLALQAPVKMLFPLIMFIFPCTFIVIAFPIAVKLLALVE